MFWVFSLRWGDMINIADINTEIYNKKIISFLIQYKNERLTEILQGVRCHILWSY